MDSLVSSTKNLKKKEYKSFSNSSKKVEENTFKLILQGQYYPDTKIKQRHPQGKKITGWYTQNIDADILDKISANTLKDLHNDQLGFIHDMQEWVNICKSILCYISVIKWIKIT